MNINILHSYGLKFREKYNPLLSIYVKIRARMIKNLMKLLKLLCVAGNIDIVDFMRFWHRLKPMSVNTLDVSGNACSVLLMQNNAAEK